MKSLFILTVCLFLVSVRSDELDPGFDPEQPHFEEEGPELDTTAPETDAGVTTEDTGDEWTTSKKPPSDIREDVTLAPPKPTKIFNDRLDEIIKETINRHHDEIVPYRLPNQTVGFWRKIGPVNVSGEAGFLNNELTGLMNVRRINDAKLGKTKWGNVEMSLDLDIGPIQVVTDGYAKFLGVGPRVKYQVSVIHVTASSVLHMNHITNQVAVKSFKVGEILGLDFKILKSPLFITPFVANQIIRGGINIFTPLIKTGVTKAGGVIIDKLITDSQFVKDVMSEADLQ